MLPQRSHHLINCRLVYSLAYWQLAGEFYVSQCCLNISLCLWWCRKRIRAKHSNFYITDSTLICNYQRSISFSNRNVWQNTLPKVAKVHGNNFEKTSLLFSPKIKNNYFSSREKKGRILMKVHCTMDWTFIPKHFTYCLQTEIINKNLTPRLDLSNFVHLGNA